MSKGLQIAITVFGGLLVLLLIVSGGIGVSALSTYNQLQRENAAVDGYWSEVLNQYQRRSDLVPQIVSVVQGYATHEKSTLIGVTQARAAATSITMTPATLNNAQEMAKFQQAQGALGGFLSKLMVASERYPELKANKQFTDLQVQIEGTENRIATARNRYIIAAQKWNGEISTWPSSMIANFAGLQKKVLFQPDNEKAIKNVPVIKFN